MKILLVSAFLFLISPAFAQSIEFAAGMNQNRLYEIPFPFGVPNDKKSFTPQNGYAMYLALNSVLFGENKVRFSVGFERFDGRSKVVFQDGVGGKTTTYIHSQKGQITFGFLPLDLTIAKRIQVDFGLTVSSLLHEESEILKIVRLSGKPTYIWHTQDQEDTKLFAGLKLRVAYLLHITERLSLTPQYGLHIGLSNEFVTSPEALKSLRHVFLVGLQWNLENKQQAQST